jgi:5-methylcytosine-specific restriction endonuclease McrA
MLIRYSTEEKNVTKKFENWLQSHLRLASYKYLPRNNVKTAARVSRGRYKCAACGEVFKSGEVQLDHIVPVVDPIDGFPRLPNGEADWNTYIARLFVPESGWQVICRPCHTVKTNTENMVRRSGSK